MEVVVLVFVDKKYFFVAIIDSKTILEQHYWLEEKSLFKKFSNCL